MDLAIFLVSLAIETAKERREDGEGGEMNKQSGEVRCHNSEHETYRM